MLNKLFTILAALTVAAATLSTAARAAEGAPANALMVVPAETAFDKKFQDFLDKKGAKLLESHPPSVFIGHIPQELDKQLKEKFGALVYRGKVEDWSSFARYGEKAVFAVNSWNKRFVEDPPEAPLVVSSGVQKTGRGKGIKLFWNEVMKAYAYRLQISRTDDFGAVYLETSLNDNHFTIYPSLLPDGVYYWRVAALLRLNTGEIRGDPFSEVYSFAVSNAAFAKAGRLPAPPAQENVSVRNGALRWQDSPGDKYFRLQFSESEDFQIPAADVFTDTCSYKMSGLPLEDGRKYYMRVMASDGKYAGDWSGPAAVPQESQPAGKKRGKKR